LEGFFFELSHRVGSAFERICNFFIDLRGDEVELGEDGLLEAVVLDHPQLLEVHEEGPENSDEQLQLLALHLCYAQDLPPRQPLLSAY
jgi:hypothetical protein